MADVQPIATSAPIAELEQLIHRGSIDDNFDAARAVLRNWLSQQSGNPGKGLSIADAIAQIERNPHQGATSAKVLLRCLAIPNLLPQPNAANQLVRTIVTLCEDALPDICDFLGINAVKQNHEKFKILSAAHHRVADVLSPFIAKYIGLESLLSARKAILSALNHSIIRSYCEPFQNRGSPKYCRDNINPPSESRLAGSNIGS